MPELGFSLPGSSKTVQPPKPPDDGGGDGGSESTTKLSFQDKITPQVVRNLVQEGIMKLEHEGGNRLLPKFVIEPNVFDQLCQLWKKYLVKKLLGKNSGFLTMREKLQAIWKLEGGFELMNITNGYFMVSLDVEVDQENIINKRPWMTYDHYLTLSLDFKVFNVRIKGREDFGMD
ncbi:hypothetical protein CR513_16335, partial [Mucuna pruriens]